MSSCAQTLGKSSQPSGMSGNLCCGSGTTDESQVHIETRALGLGEDEAGTSEELVRLLKAENAVLQNDNASLQKEVFELKQLLLKDGQQVPLTERTEDSSKPFIEGSAKAENDAKTENDTIEKRHSVNSAASHLDSVQQEEAVEIVATHVIAEEDVQAIPWSRLALLSSALFLAFAGVIFVLVAKSQKLGEEDAGQGSAVGCASADHRRLGAGPPPLLAMICFTVTGAGLCAYLVNLIQQPLILGYLIAGFCLGPEVLDIVHESSDIQDFSSLGLTFLLFLVGLEIDVTELLKMGKVVLVVGLGQFPLCSIIHFGLFSALAAAGVNFGSGNSVFYVAICCAISSTMIVAKILSENADMDSQPGRLTVGILIFQDIWAIIVLTVQPDLADPQPLKVLTNFAKILVLLIVAVLYAKFAMGAVFRKASGNSELLLVSALSWCFFIASFAILGFMGQGMELAALIAGAALASFPYTAELNGKVKFVRDFFITIFFTGLGMQIPVPDIQVLATALLVAALVLLVRWIGVFLLVMLLGGGARLAAVATINLSEVSEFGLVICSLGIGFDHIDRDTLTLQIWTFSMLAILSANALPFNYRIYNKMVEIGKKFRKKKASAAGMDRQISDEDESHGDRNIVLLGFHKIAATFVNRLFYCEHNSALLHRMHVVDFNEKVLAAVRTKEVTTTYGDISSPDVLEHCVHGEVKLVISTIPDNMLRGTSNLELMKVSKKVWPDCRFVGIADSPLDSQKLYDGGCDFVIEMAELVAKSYTEVLVTLTSAMEVTHTAMGADIADKHHHHGSHNRRFSTTFSRINSW